MNRSTIYEYLKGTELELRFIKIGRGNFPVLKIPYSWEESYVMINSMRVTDFQAIILFTNELVVRFTPYDNWQINIPYKDIESFEVCNDLDIGYSRLHQGKKEYH